MGGAMLHLAIVFAEMARDLAQGRGQWRGWSGVKATVGLRKRVSRRWDEKIQNMHSRDGLS